MTLQAVPEELTRANPDLLFQLGCVRSLCAGAAGEGPDRERLIRAAASVLEEAIDHGFRDRNSLETDPDLDDVRGDSEFARIIERLTQPQSEG